MKTFPLVSLQMAHVRHVATGVNDLGWVPMYGGDFAAMARDWFERIAPIADGVYLNRADGCCRRRLVGSRERILSGGDGLAPEAGGPDDGPGDGPTDDGDGSTDGGRRVRVEEVRSEVASADMVSHEQHRARCYIVRGLASSTRVIWGTGIPSRAGMELALERLAELHVREVTVDVSGMNIDDNAADFMTRLGKIVDTVYHEPLCHPAQFVEPPHSKATPTASLPQRFLLEGLDPARLAGSIAMHNTNFPMTAEWAERWAALGVTPTRARRDALKEAHEVREMETLAGMDSGGSGDGDA